MNLAKRGSLIGILGVSLALLVLVSMVSWGGADVGSTWLSATFIALSLGALYAMYATGLVVVYTTTGIFNFAQVAIGVFSAFLYWELTTGDGFEIRGFTWMPGGLHPLVALAIVVLVVAPIIGVLLDVVLMRRLQNSTLVIQLMVTVGLMVLFLAATGQIWDGRTNRRVSPFFETTSGLEINIGATSATVTWHRIIVLLVALAVTAALVLLFRSRLGVAMRAVVDDPALSALNGARPALISASAWAIGAVLSAIAGILIAPEFDLKPEVLNGIIVWAFAAAAFGQLRSLPLAFAGAMVLGFGKTYVQQYLETPDFPFAPDLVAPIVLFLVIWALPQARLTVGRAASNLRRIERKTSVPEAVLGGVAFIVLLYVLSEGLLNFNLGWGPLTWDPGPWSDISFNRAATALTTAMIGLSLVPLTGWAGQVNLAPLAFAGFGAFLYLALPSNSSGNVLWLLVIFALTAPIGAIVAAPLARLRGLYLALGSMAFAVAMSRAFFPHESIFTGRRVETPLNLFGWEFDTRRSYMFLCVVIVVLTMVFLTWLRRTSFGRRWVALNDSPAAAATVGINVFETKVIVYALSAGLAGMGGVFYAHNVVAPDGVQMFVLLEGLAIVLLMAVGGMSFPAAFIFTMFLPINIAVEERYNDLGNVEDLAHIQGIMGRLGVGLAAVGLVINQRGAVFRTGRDLARFLPWRADAREEHALEQAAGSEAEIGELGLTRAFTPEDVVALDRALRIEEDIVPAGGYRANHVVLAARDIDLTGQANGSSSAAQRKVPVSGKTK